MAAQSLTVFQKRVLSEVFRDRSAGPRSIAITLNVKVAIVLKAIYALRRLDYLVHHQPPSCFGGNGPVYRPIRTIKGNPVPEMADTDTAAQIREYLKAHDVKKLPPGRAHGTYKSEHWDVEL